MNKNTLEKLESDYWEEPEFKSHLVVECHRLRKIPIDDFDVENLRIMLGQKIGVKHLLPKALEVLLEDPLAEGDFYPGDLLGVVLALENLDAEQVATLNEIISRIHVPSEITEVYEKYQQNYA